MILLFDRWAAEGIGQLARGGGSVHRIGWSIAARHAFPESITGEIAAALSSKSQFAY